jgi:hypothetical protein
VEVTGAAAWLTADVAALAEWVTAEVTGAAACVTVEVTGVAGDGADDVAGAVVEGVCGAGETAEATPFRVLVTVPVTALVTAPRRPPDEAGVVEDGVATSTRLLVAAWALVPDSSQNTAINPKQQARSTTPRAATRPVHPRPGITCAAGAA